MILVDTNVWSELTRAQPEPNVRRWEKANADRLWLPTIVIGELLSGAHMLPEGRRKQNFLVGYARLIALHEDRIVPFDLDAAQKFGPVLAYLESSGRNPTTADAQLAAIALSRGMALATRNAKDFVDLGLELINPWEG
jgi:predicted nucleic acid-binding protein